MRHDESGPIADLETQLDEVSGANRGLSPEDPRTGIVTQRQEGHLGYGQPVIGLQARFQIVARNIGRWFAHRATLAHNASAGGWRFCAQGHTASPKWHSGFVAADGWKGEGCANERHAPQHPSKMRVTSIWWREPVSM